VLYYSDTRLVSSGECSNSCTISLLAYTGRDRATKNSFVLKLKIDNVGDNGNGSDVGEH
jgi:hypothetical protein